MAQFEDAPIQFHGEVYIQKMVLSRLDDSGQHTSFLSIFELSKTEINIINDINKPLPFVEIYVRDQQARYLPRYPLDGRSFVTVYVSYQTPQSQTNGQGVSSQESGQNVILQHTFIINDIEPYRNRTDESWFKITGVSELVPLWAYSSIRFSTHNRPMQATQIIQDMMGDTQFPFTLPNDFKHCKRVLPHYIAPQNMSLQDNVNFLLSQSHDEDNGFYFFTWNLINNVSTILSVKQQYEKGLVNKFDAILYPSRYGFTEIIGTPEDITSENFIKGVYLYDKANTVALWNYNYNNREWSKDVFTQPRMDKFLPKVQKAGQGEFESLFKPITEKYTKTKFSFEQQRTPQNYEYVSERLKELLNFNETLQFTTYGFIKREVGDIYLVGADTPSAFYRRYTGLWFISRISHTFAKNRYMQNICLIRADKLATKLGDLNKTGQQGTVTG